MKGMRAVWMALVWALPLAAAGCLPAVETAPPATGAAAAPAPRTRLEFFDTMAFDQDLSDALGAAAPEVKVVPLAPVSLNAMPERLDKWLSAIRQTGGAVRTVTASKAGGRGIMGAGIDVVVALFDMGREHVLYAPAAGYDADILYDAKSGLVNEIVLRRRAEAVPAEAAPVPVKAPALTKPAPAKPAPAKPLPAKPAPAKR